MPPTITTARLRHELLDLAHLNEVHGLFSAPGHTIGAGPIIDVDETQRWLRRRREAYATLGLAWYGLWMRTMTSSVSWGVLQGERCGPDPEIGYEIASPMRGLGLAP